MAPEQIDNILMYAGYVTTVILAITMIVRGLHRQFPVFISYLVFGLVTDPLMFWMYSHMPATYPNAFILSSIVDFVFQVCVLLEIASSVLRPVKKSLPARSLLVFGLLVLFATGATALLAYKVLPHSSLAHLPVFLQKIGLALALMRMGIFVAIAVFAQMLGIGWKNHVLQLATGLAFYSAVSLIIETAHSRVGLGDQFHALDQMMVASYLGTMAFWIWSFSQKEAVRKEFSPQMQNFLLSIAGSTRSSRIGLEAAVNSKSTSRKR
jgi:hypothetical protein